MLRNSLFIKILLIFLLPAVGLFYFSTIIAIQKNNTLYEVDKVQSDIEYIVTIEKVINSIQKERSYTVSYLSTGTNKNQLLQQRELTNKIYNTFIKTVQRRQKQISEINFNIEKIQKIFYNISLLRENIENKINLSEVIFSYCKINKELLDTISIMNPTKFITGFNIKLLHIKNILYAQEAAEIELLLTSRFIIQKKLSNKNYKKLIGTYAIQDFNIQEFLLNIINDLTMYDKIVEKTYNYDKKQKQMRRNLKELVENEKLSLDSFKEHSLARIDNFEKIYSLVINRILERSLKIKQEAIKSKIFSFIFLSISLTTLISLFFILRVIALNQEKNYEQIKRQHYVYKVLNKINKIILKMKTKEDIFDNILEPIVNNSNMSNISLGIIYKVKKLQKNVSIIKGQNYKDVTFKNEESINSIFEKVILAKKNIIKTSNIEKYTDLNNDFVKSNNLESMAIFPVKVFDKVIALLALYSTRKKFFNREIEIVIRKTINDIGYALEKINYEKTKRKQEERLTIASYAFESNEPMFIANDQLKIIKANQAFCNIMGYKKKEIISKIPNIFRSDEHSEQFYSSIWSSVFEKGTWTGELYNKTKNGENIPLKVTITVIKEKKDRIKYYVFQYNDISEQKLRQQYLEYQAMHDSLTALPNRTLLFDRIEHSINKVTRHKTYGALIFIDLDNFKTINDTLGHETGDILLREVAKKLQDTVRKEDTIGRIGGDEFIILSDFIGEDEISARNNTQIFASKIKDSLNSIKIINGYENISTPSIGITLFNNSVFSVKELIKQADTAMYISKRAGKNQISFFE